MEEKKSLNFSIKEWRNEETSRVGSLEDSLYFMMNIIAVDGLLKACQPFIVCCEGDS